MTQAPPVRTEQSGEMTHRQVLALPTLVDDLEGCQTGYTTPIWGRFRSTAGVAP